MFNAKHLNIDTCNTCGCTFNEVDCHHAPMKDRAWAATLDRNGKVVQECCEQCQQEIFDELQDEEWG